MANTNNAIGSADVAAGSIANGRVASASGVVESKRTDSRVVAAGGVVKSAFDTDGRVAVRRWCC